MNNTAKKVGYLKGLLDSLTLDENSASDKLLKGIVELLGDLNDRADAMDDLIDDLSDYVESIDDDLMLLEDAETDDMDDEDFDDFDDEDDFEDDFEAEDHLHILQPKLPEKEEEVSFEGKFCPECQRMFFVSVKDPKHSKYICPHCNLKVEPVLLSLENVPIVEPAE